MNIEPNDVIFTFEMREGLTNYSEVLRFWIGEHISFLVEENSRKIMISWTGLLKWLNIVWSVYAENLGI